MKQREGAKQALACGGRDREYAAGCSEKERRSADGVYCCHSGMHLEATIEASMSVRFV
jgi:hypothetical protein